MSLLYDKYENIFDMIQDSYNSLLKNLENNQNNINSEIVDLSNLILNDATSLALKLDTLSNMINKNKYKISEQNTKDLKNLEKREKIFKNLMPILFLVDEYIRIESE